MADLGYGVFDADNHYYEAEDAFTRYAEPGMDRRTMQWVELNGKRKLLVGGKINTFIPNPTFDPIAKPGTLVEFFQGKGEKSVKELFGDLEPIRPEYRDRDARLKVMDEQGVDAAWMFPTLGVGMEEALAGDPPAAMAAFRAFNRWLDDDWGFAYQDRIFAAPYFSLMHLDEAVADLRWALDRGARVICLRPAPVRMPGGSESPFTEEYDAFWGLVAEAGITVAFHGGDSGYAQLVKWWEPRAQYKAFFATPLERVLTSSRAISDTVAAMVCHKVLERFPRLRVASIENGTGWLSSLVRKLDLAHVQTPGWFSVKPSEIVQRQMWLSPFWEDKPAEAARRLGFDRTLFGSDWPHTEGIAEPASYVDSLDGLDDAAVRKVMRDNTWELTVPLSS